MSLSPIAGAALDAGYRTFASALRATTHIRILESKGPFTVFAPRDAAFEKFSRASLGQLLNGDPELLERVIGYHFAPGRVGASAFTGKRIRAVMHAGGDIIINGREGLRVNAANIVEPDIQAANGVIHGIDAVLWPAEPELAAEAS